MLIAFEPPSARLARRLLKQAYAKLAEWMQMGAKSTPTLTLDAMQTLYGVTDVLYKEKKKLYRTLVQVSRRL